MGTIEEILETASKASGKPAHVAECIRDANGRLVEVHVGLEGVPGMIKTRIDEEPKKPRKRYPKKNKYPSILKELQEL